MEFSLDTEDEIVSVGDLKDAFYSKHVWKRKELTAAARRKKKKVALNAQRLVSNPEGWGSTEDVTRSDIWIAVYYRGYYVRVECGKNMLGVHKAELFYQIRTGCRVWLGTTTFKQLFFDKKKLRKNLRLAIVAKRYYCTDASAAKFVNLAEEITKVEKL